MAMIKQKYKCPECGHICRLDEMFVDFSDPHDDEP